MFPPSNNDQRKFRSQTSDNIDRQIKKQRREESERRREEERRSEEKKDQKKEDPGARKGRKVAKIRLAKVAGVEPLEMKDKKLHAIGARSTFQSPNVKNTPFSDHFWKLTCRKSARRCGAKHIWNPKCAKHTRFGALLEVEMLKKCMAQNTFRSDMCKPHLRTTFGS